ncbi:MAG: CDP-alcohol phosphatidyltransferase family protein [Myxococcota bacterium]|nr:CDP-alcohol phosphatidyltransferase family protein [Myxococcota bacterium]
MKTTDTPPAAWVLPGPSPSPFVLWGLTPAERLQRSAERSGCSPARILAPEGLPDPPPAGGVLLLSADWIYDPRLVEALAETPDTALLEPEGERCVAAHVPAARATDVAASLRNGGALTGLRAVRPQELVAPYTAKLRKSEPPYLLPALASHRAELEARTFSASYKGATDLVTKWLWPVPARAVTRWLAAAHVRPNTVTLLSWVLAVATFWLFWRGAFGLGLVAAWLMTFLDTVDGKLARVTLTSSRLGDVLDHGLDLAHPPFWWWAWGVGVGPAAAPATLVVVAGYFVGRALEGVFLARFSFETHSWRRIDTLFRTVTARRNPNLVFLTVGSLGGRPDLGITMVALWTVASLGFHAVRLAQALLVRARGEAVEPWDEALKGELRPIEETGQKEPRSP